MFQAVSSIVCGFILALAATVLLIQVKWHKISTLWPRFGNYYLWIRVHLCYFPLLQLSIYQNFLVEQYEAKVCIHQLLAFVEQQSCLTLSSCISNLLANKPLLFLLRWKWQSNLLTYLAQVFAGVLALITSILYFLAAAFAYKTIKDNMWILSIFTNIYVQVLKLYFLKLKLAFVIVIFVLSWKGVTCTGKILPILTPDFVKLIALRGEERIINYKIWKWP